MFALATKHLLISQLSLVFLSAMAAAAVQLPFPLHPCSADAFLEQQGCLNDEEVINDKYRYNRVRKLNTGGSATVFEAVDMCTGRLVAVKRVRATEELELRLRKEFEIQQECAHPNIVAALDFIKGHRHVYLVQELMTGGDLYEHIAAGKEMSELKAIAIIRAVLSALAYLHAREIVHGDIKVENVMLNANGEVKITDFGFACTTYAKHETTMGTKEYMSPEMLQYGRGNIDLKAADIWAAGILLFTLLSVKGVVYQFPWARADVSDTSFKAYRDGSRIIRPPWRRFPAATQLLLENMLCLDPERRWSAAECFYFLEKNYPTCLTPPASPSPTPSCLVVEEKSGDEKKKSPQPPACAATNFG
eukprot:comp20963_c0_seq1/m.28050 comp20963_c0_seq1/g.28050  ORF comp20963_c0_seq1/g.28050 comp20963_c0_seq1/m.28050 type:complete len:362 (-) comp20963_c0_seq1:354-1439(-)